MRSSAFDLTRLSEAVADDMAAGGPSETSFTLARLVNGMPDAVFELAERILEDAKKPAPKAKGRKRQAENADGERLTGARLFLLVMALEELRYDVEAKKAKAIAAAARLRERLVHAARQPGTELTALMLILQQFAIAKLDMGDELRALMTELIEAKGGDAPSPQSAVEDLGLQLAQLTKDLDDDPFAIHAMMDGILQTMPEEMRAMIVMAALSQDAPGAREAALGWVLNDSAAVRTLVAGALEKRMQSGAESGVMLRRMIALRNWLPEAERPPLDRAIAAGRKKVICAGWPEAKVTGAFATGFDGSGAQSIVMLATQGRKQSIAVLLFKHGIGVRDAFVHHRLSKAEVKAALADMLDEMPMSPVSLDYVASALRHFLGVNAQSGVLPPFGLIEAAETVGLTGLNPNHRDVEDVVASLCAGISPDRATPEAVDRALKASASWADHQPMLESWFDDSDEAAALLAPRKLAKAKRKAALLAMPLHKQRRHWAGLIAWTAQMIRHDPEGSGWEDHALVACELLAGGRWTRSAS